MVGETHESNKPAGSQRPEGGNQMALGLLALGRKTKAHQAEDSQGSQEAMLCYKSPVHFKVTGRFSQHSLGPIGESRARTLKRGEEAAKTGPDREMKDQQ